MAAAETILVVEDDRTISDGLREILTHVGYDAIPCYTGGEALALLQEGPVDLVLLDVMLPDMTGYEVLAQLRRRAEFDSPVVFLTGMAEVDHKVRGLELGAIDYVTKPFDPRELLARIRRALRASAQYREAMRDVPDGPGPVPNPDPKTDPALATLPFRDRLGEQRQTPRKVISAIFATVSNLEHLAEDLDTGEIQQECLRVQQVCAQVAESYSGRLARDVGDAIVAVFGLAHAVPDAPARATSAALHIQRAISRQRDGRNAARACPHLRVAVSSQELPVGSDFADRAQRTSAVGDIISIAGQLEPLCPPGKVLITAPTLRWLGRGFLAKAASAIAVKGREGSIQTFLVDLAPQ
ncbi:MAG: response regulator [Candidatus Schekmanbacteria bacterium]|nr:response regulator [Candidatus Schekmanbacteria bacterium]